MVEEHGKMLVHFYKSFLRVGITNISWQLLSDPLNYDVDIVHIHFDLLSSIIAGLRYVKRRRKPLIVTWHGDWVENYGSIIRRIGVYLSNKYIVGRLLSRAEVIVTPSRYYIEESKFLKKYKKKVVEIPNGVDLEAFNISHSKHECRKILGLNNAEKIVLFLSTLYPLKGPQILLKAIPEIIKEHKNTLFVFAGGGYVEKYKKLSEKIRVQNYVKFTGYVFDDLKPYYYKAADIFVLPSTEVEVFPLVLLEASASGLPMVVSDLNTFKSIIEDGYNGIVTKRGGSRSLADAIIYLLENEDTCRKMGERSREKARDYSWDKIAEKYEEIYEDVISYLMSDAT